MSSQYKGNRALPVYGLLSGALVWGLIWYPYRVLSDAGVAGQIATVWTYSIALLIGLTLSGGWWREWRLAGWPGVLLIVSAGWTNLGYVLAVLDGEVMRVLLLFYLAPLWTVVLARLLLGERLNRDGYAVSALSLAGAFVMLWQPESGWPLPQNRAEWLGLSAGMSFALANVLVRRASHLSVAFKSASVWFGTALLTLAGLLLEGKTAALLAVPAEAWWLLALLGLVLFATSYAVQFGLSHLPANQSIVLFLFELVVAALAAYWLAGEALGWRELTGAGLIVAASVWSARLEPGAA